MLNQNPQEKAKVISLEQARYVLQREERMKTFPADVEEALAACNARLMSFLENECNTYGELFSLLVQIHYGVSGMSRYRERIDENCTLLIGNLKENGQKYNALAELYYIWWWNNIKNSGYMAAEDYEAKAKGWI